MAGTVKSDVSSVIQEIVGDLMTETLIQESVMIPCVRDFSAQIGPEMDTYEVPLYSELAVQDVLEAQNDMTPQTINVLTDKLLLNRHKSIPFSIGDLASIQAKQNMIQVTVENGARSLAAEIDDAILAEMYALTAGGNYNALTGNALNDILEARRILNAARVPMSDRYLIVSPGFEAEILKEGQFVKANEYGSARPVQAGEIGTIFGFVVKMSTSSEVLDDGFMAMHQASCGFGRQIAPKFERQRQVLGQRDDYALSHLYGVKGLDPAGIRSVVFDSDGVK